MWEIKLNSTGIQWSYFEFYLNIPMIFDKVIKKAPNKMNTFNSFKNIG